MPVWTHCDSPGAPVEAGQEWRAFLRAVCTIHFMTNRTFKSGESREQPSLFPPRVEDYVGADNPVRAIDSFVCALDLAKLGFRHADHRVGVGQPPYDPSDLLKLYLYGYINQIRSSRRLEREACRNLELIWLLEEPKARLPDDRQLPQGELGGPEGREPQLRAVASRTRPGRWNPCCSRWRLVPRQRQQGQHLHAREARQTDRPAGSGDRDLREVPRRQRCNRGQAALPVVWRMATRVAAAMSGTK